MGSAGERDTKTTLRGVDKDNSKKVECVGTVHLLQQCLDHRCLVL